MRDKSAYTILNLRKGADEKEIKRAYVEMVKKYDPEKHTDRFMVIQNAYERLKDPKKRAAEDCFTFNPVKPEFSFAQDERASLSEIEIIQRCKQLEAQYLENKHNPQLRQELCKAKMMRSWQLFNEKKYREALKVWEEIIQIDSLHRRAKNNLNYLQVYLGYFYAEHELYEDAIACWENALQINPDNLPVLHNLALGAEFCGDVRRAERYWNETLKRWKQLLDKDPNNEYLKASIIEVRKHHGNKALDSGEKSTAAIAEYREVLKIQPDDYQAQHQMAIAQIDNKDFISAVNTLQRLRNKHPRNTELLNMLGHAQLNSGSVNEAFNTWKQSLKIDPKNFTTRDYMIKAHLTVGKKFRDSGQFIQALVHLKQLEKLMPNSEEVYFELANTYLQKGDKRSALAQFQKVLDINPQNKLAKKSMSELRLRG